MQRAKAEQALQVDNDGLLAMPESPARPIELGRVLINQIHDLGLANVCCKSQMDGFAAQ
jgi:hypothetical protein